MLWKAMDPRLRGDDERGRSGTLSCGVVLRTNIPGMRGSGTWKKDAIIRH
jgi:hypothetical protein